METFTVKATLSHPEHRGTALTLDLPLGEVRCTINGRSLTTPYLIGAPDAPALLGAVTQEAFGLAADPVQKILVPVTGLLL